MTSRQRRRWPWEPPTGSPAAMVPPPDVGIYVMCGRHRVMAAGFRRAVPDVMFYAGPGRGVVHAPMAPGDLDREGLVWRRIGIGPTELAHLPTLKFGCRGHGEHLVSLPRVLEELNRRGRARPGQNFPRVGVSDVLADPPAR